MKYSWSQTGDVALSISAWDEVFPSWSQTGDVALSISAWDEVFPSWSQTGDVALSISEWDEMFPFLGTNWRCRSLNICMRWSVSKPRPTPQQGQFKFIWMYTCIGKVVTSHAEGCKIESRLWLRCTDLYYARDAQGVLRGITATSQLNLPSLAPLSVAGFCQL